MKFWTKFKFLYKAASPDLRKRLVIIFSILLIFNLAVWIFAFLAAPLYPLLFGLVVLAYSFGLRHAVDADHIAAIDNATRKLMQDGKRPVAVGFYFSLGHSTIVILLSIIVAVSAAYIKQNLPALENTVSIIGTSVSSFFLLIIGIINLIILIDIYKIWRKVRKGGKYDDKSLNEHLSKRGFLARILAPFLKSLKNSWNLYPVGFLFGLGFDTASEVGLLGISAATGAAGMPIGYILLLPLAFTAGMTLIDTLNGILMLGAYGWAFIKPLRKLYYNMCITFISVIIALFIGTVEGLQVISEKTGMTTGIFTFINKLEFGNLGYITIGIFAASWFISVLIYKFQGYDLLEINEETQVSKTAKKKDTKISR